MFLADIQNLRPGPNWHRCKTSQMLATTKSEVYIHWYIKFRRCRLCVVIWQRGVKGYFVFLEISGPRFGTVTNTSLQMQKNTANCKKSQNSLKTWLAHQSAPQTDKKKRIQEGQSINPNRCRNSILVLSTLWFGTIWVLSTLGAPTLKFHQSMVFIQPH